MTFNQNIISLPKYKKPTSGCQGILPSVRPQDYLRRNDPYFVPVIATLCIFQ